MGVESDDVTPACCSVASYTDTANTCQLASTTIGTVSQMKNNPWLFALSRSSCFKRLESKEMNRLLQVELC
ncbi:hypothetical protein F2P81_000151 [Scophthalmus maximus]|uniref:Uncharacterized protein n=1 Tax=Scophthalmus maximus TaxID=52904 RepID=A0A6A4TQ88_SCOMX|nr:hypothetical protein F2P81_000151 [Scophthalmus maximus]